MQVFQLNSVSKKGPMKTKDDTGEKQHFLLQVQMHLNDSLLNIQSHVYVYQGNRLPFWWRAISRQFSV